jgi:hypothetical protein
VTHDMLELPGAAQPVGRAKAPGGHRYFEGVVTESRFRPLARRRLRTARPPAVFMRERNPWTRRRRTRLGWYVRFIGRASRRVRPEVGRASAAA